MAVCRYGIVVPVVAGRDAHRTMILFVEHKRTVAFTPAEVVAFAHVIDRLDVMLADMRQEHSVPCTGIPAETVGIAHAAREDLPLSGRWVHAQDFPKRHRRVLRNVG